MPQHKTPDCKGQWVDISTLADPPPGRVICSSCRATGPKPADDDQVVDAVDLNEDEIAGLEADEMRDQAMRTIRRGIFILIVAGLSFVMGVVVGRLGA